MRAVRATSDGVAVVDVPSPHAAGTADPVRVQPVSVGICGPDLHVIGMGPSDVTLGHEISAMHEGRPVAIQPMAFCGECAACQRGDQHMCSTGGRRGPRPATRPRRHLDQPSVRTRQCRPCIHNCSRPSRGSRQGRRRHQQHLTSSGWRRAAVGFLLDWGRVPVGRRGGLALGAHCGHAIS